MMRTRERVGVAVRQEGTEEILVETFPVSAPRGRWARWPLVRGALAIRTAITTGQRALSVSERLRWSAPADAPAEDEEPELGTIGKALVGLAALGGAALQIATFRIGPIVIAKEAGLTGGAFIVADAMLRLTLMLGMLWVLSRFRPFRRILSYHGAEHKAIAAHEAGAPLTAAAAAGFTRFHPRCGTSFLVVSALVSIAVYGAVLAITGIFTYPALIATRIIGAPVVTAIAFELQRQAARHASGRLRILSAPGMLAQRLTTAEPGTRELEVACAALAAALGEQPATGVTEPARAPTPAPLPVIDPQPSI